MADNTAKRNAAKRTSPKAEASKHATKLAETRAIKRADLGAGVGGYFAALNGEHRSIAESLREIIEKAAPQARATIKWGMPVYEHRGMLCYIRARPKYITLGFYESGVSLTDPDGQLEGTGDNMRHIKVPNLAAVNPAYFKRMVKEAVRFNEQGA